jgi:hypothetical protein
MSKKTKLPAWMALLSAVAAGVALIRHGFSARDTPSALEAYVARVTRKLAVPASARDQKKPFMATTEVLAEARAHFADHCAICHANNDSAATQRLVRTLPQGS